MLSEALTHIGSKAGGKMAKPVYDYVTSTYDIIYPSKDMFLSAIDKFMQYNGTLSYADILALEIMELRSIDTIVSFDSDFDKVKGIKRIY
jgi:predicted nucleic acid-binding protein